MTHNFQAELMGGFGAFAECYCCYCGHRTVEIWYNLDHRIISGKAKKGCNTIIEGYKPFCAHCCEHLALGMLRDVAEMRFGKSKADADYLKLMNRVNISALARTALLTKAQIDEIEAMKAEIAERESKWDGILDNLMKGPKRMCHEEFNAIFDTTLNPRLTTDAALRERIAKLSGMSVKQLGKRVDLKKLTIDKGPGIEILQVPPTNSNPASSGYLD